MPELYLLQTTPRQIPDVYYEENLLGTIRLGLDVAAIQRSHAAIQCIYTPENAMVLPTGSLLFMLWEAGKRPKQEKVLERRVDRHAHTFVFNMSPIDLMTLPKPWHPFITVGSKPPGWRELETEVGAFLKAHSLPAVA